MRTLIGWVVKFLGSMFYSWMLIQVIMFVFLGNKAFWLPNTYDSWTKVVVLALFFEFMAGIKHVANVLEHRRRMKTLEKLHAVMRGPSVEM